MKFKVTVNVEIEDMPPAAPLETDGVRGMLLPPAGMTLTFGTDGTSFDDFMKLVGFLHRVPYEVLAMYDEAKAFEAAHK